MKANRASVAVSPSGRRPASHSSSTAIHPRPCGSYNRRVRSVHGAAELRHAVAAGGSGLVHPEDARFSIAPVHGGAIHAERARDGAGILAAVALVAKTLLYATNA
jgi:hypothetical protein